MSDLSSFRDFGVGAGVLAMAARLVAPVVQSLARLGHRNGNGASGAATYLEGKDAGEVLLHLKQIAENTTRIPDIARTNSEILVAVAGTREDLVKHEAAAQRRSEGVERRVIAKIAESKEFKPRTRRKST